MRAAEITDAKSLRAWLETQPREVCVWIAARAAARVLPLYWREVAQNTTAGNGALTALPVCFALLAASSYVVADEDSVKTRLAAYAADNASAYANAASNAARNAATHATHAADAKAAANAKAAAAHASASESAVDAAAADAPYVALAASASAHAAAHAKAAAAYAADARWVEANGVRAGHPLWPEGMPDEIAEAWVATRQSLPEPAKDQPDYRSFWLPWYQGLLDGTPTFPKSLTEAVALIDEEDWKKGDLHINNTVIPALMAVHAPSLLDAAPVDFTFDAMHRVMRMVGVTNLADHLRDPRIVQAFLDDADEIRDLLQEFSDDARELSGAGNMAGPLRRRADKILREFDRAQDKMHLRAETLVIAASEIETFSKDPKAREDLGATLSGFLDTRIGMLKRLCRTYFGPSYVTLAPLADLELDQIDQEEVCVLFDDAISKLETLPDDGMVPPDAEAIAVLHDMLRDLHEFRAAISEATGAEFKEIMESRFAQSSGALGLSLGKYLQRASEVDDKVNKSAERALRTVRNGKGLLDILKAVAGFFSSGGG